MLIFYSLRYLDCQLLNNIKSKRTWERGFDFHKLKSETERGREKYSLKNSDGKQMTRAWSRRSGANESRPVGDRRDNNISRYGCQNHLIANDETAIFDTRQGRDRHLGTKTRKPCKLSPKFWPGNKPRKGKWKKMKLKVKILTNSEEISWTQKLNREIL